MALIPVSAIYYSFEATNSELFEIMKAKQHKYIVVSFINICFHLLNLVLVSKRKKKDVICLKLTMKVINERIL